MRPIDVSLVVPVRDEAGNIGPLVAEIRERLDAAGLSWEAFLVDDGSTDGSWNEIVETAAADPLTCDWERVVERRFGKALVRLLRAPA
jgi:glycosyltransferase involved in cell wall biosynthesis